MRKFVRNHWFLAVFLGLGCFVLWHFFTYVCGLWPTMASGDKGTWAGAVGTVATLAGTIWLATSERRARLSSERALARVRCLEIVARQDDIFPDLEGAIRILEKDMTMISEMDCLRCADELSMLPRWTAQDVVPIASLLGNVASLLIRSSQNIKHAEARLRRMGEIGFEDFLAKRPRIILQLKTSVDAMRSAQNICKDFIDR